MSMTSAGSLRPAGYWMTIAIPFHLLRPLTYQAIPRRFCRGCNFLRPWWRERHCWAYDDVRLFNRWIFAHRTHDGYQ